MDFYDRFIKYVAIFTIVTTIGILYDKYRSKYLPDDELDKIDIIDKYLLGKNGIKDKPFLWIHSESVNKEQYIKSCTDTVIKHCNDNFNICLIDDVDTIFVIHVP